MKYKILKLFFKYNKGGMGITKPEPIFNFGKKPQTH